MIILGIDPGKKGGWSEWRQEIIHTAFGQESILDKKFTLERADGLNRYDLADLPFPDVMREVDQNYRGVAYIEQPLFHRTGRGKSQSKTTASIWRSFGQLEGICTALGFKVITVEPRDWQTVFAGYPGANSKAKMKAMIEREFPDAIEHCTGPRGAWLDGPADAIGIGYYGTLMERGK